MEDYDNYGNYGNYTYVYDNLTPSVQPVFKKSSCFKEALCISLLVVNMLTFLLGLCGNGVVIWIAGFKMKKTVNTTWYLSLAISDFILCASLPFTITYWVMDEWVFGPFMCKFTSFVMFLNMFGSIFLLVIISADRCVSVMFPVWAQNQRTIRKATVVVVLAWAASIALSVPSVIFRDIKKYLGKTTCSNDYTPNPHIHMAIAVSRFICGFIIPFFIIIICYSVIILRLRTNRMTKSSKPFKVMTALIATFFICWLPYHVFILLALNHRNNVTVGLKVGTCMALANSFLNPMLYVFMGSDFKQKFTSSVFNKLANALGEENRTTTSRYLSRSSSVDGRVSTHI